jgi:hypothetical protein
LHSRLFEVDLLEEEKLLPELLLFAEVELEPELSPAAMRAKSPITGLKRMEIPAQAPGLLFRSLATKATSAAPASQPRKIAMPIKEDQLG